MAFSKSHLFNKADQSTSSFSKALSHPVRLDILRQLAENDSCSVDYLNKLYPISKSTLSQHLGSLRELGLITYREEYPRTFYSLNTQALLHYFSGFFTFYNNLNIK